jgi:hypothetical protein
MSATGKNVLPLFGEEDLRQVNATGSAWINDPNDPATVPVPLQVIMVKVDGPYTERDRKLWTFLLHAVWDELGKEPVHSLSVSEINRVFRDAGGDHNTGWVWDSAKRLAKTTVEWEYTLEDERFQGISSIFGAVISKAAKSTGHIRFHFPPLLIPIIKQPQRFARLRVHFMIGLSGKYAVTLYELLEGYANRRDGQFECLISDLRTWLKVPEGSYLDWKDFKKWVLDPSLEQINKDPSGAGFSVSYEPIRQGRFYDRLRFTISKARHRVQSETKIKSRIAMAKAIADAKANNRPVLLVHHIEKARAATDYILDMGVVESEFWGHWETTGRPDFIKGVEAAFVGFAKKKLRDYRNIRK